MQLSASAVSRIVSYAPEFKSTFFAVQLVVRHLDVDAVLGKEPRRCLLDENKFPT